MLSFKRCARLVVAVLLIASVTHAAPPALPEAPIAFVGNTFELPAGAAGPVRVLTRTGWQSEPAPATQGEHPALRLTREGLYFLGDNPAHRVIALSPPPTLNSAALRKALPRSAEKLLSGKPFTLLAVGDSVTATGDYHRMLAKLLEQATGNRQIKADKRAWAGRSVDAAVRSFAAEIAPLHPDVALVMFGLNDQAANVPVEAYIEQNRWLRDQFAALGADMVLVSPTPDINLAAETETPWYAARTAPYFATLCADGLELPVVDAFNAIWENPHATPEQAYPALWSMYPPHYSKQWVTLLDTAGKGDTIHPNALGHLAVAKAAYATLAGEVPPEPLLLRAETRWTASGPVTFLAITNVASTAWKGDVKVLPQAHVALEPEPGTALELAPGVTVTRPIRWPAVHTAADLQTYPYNRALAAGTPAFAVLLAEPGKTRVRGVVAPVIADKTWMRERQICKQGPVVPELLDHGQRRPGTVSIPLTGDVGRVPLLDTTGNAPAAAELAYVRFAGALAGEAVADGSLDEWANHLWMPLGEAVQARWGRGAEDHRVSPQAFAPQWAVKAGAEAVHLAVQVRGESLEKDDLLVFFDTRAPKDLGTAGPYFWANASLKPNGQLRATAGETSPVKTGVKGAWAVRDDRQMLELTVPYATLGITAWPASGDLGMSLIWTHRGPDGQTTHLLWSEDGHPWNTRWYGVARLQPTPNRDALPWMVRVR